MLRVRDAAVTFDFRRRLAAEALGTAMLVMTVVGSGIMADKLTADDALALLGNTIPTGAILVVLITVLGPVSGAHFNPAVSLAFAVRGDLPMLDLLPFVVLAILGGLRFRADAIPWLVGLYITAAYWFTASTSFANPAVAVARALSDTFAGIRPADLPAFVVAECVGALAAVAFTRWLFAPAKPLPAEPA